MRLKDLLSCRALWARDQRQISSSPRQGEGARRADEGAARSANAVPEPPHRLAYARHFSPRGEEGDRDVTDATSHRHMRGMPTGRRCLRRAAMRKMALAAP